MSHRLARAILLPPRQSLRAPSEKNEDQDPLPKPYVEAEAAVDALAGKDRCPHGLWPHQGPCAKCATVFSFDGLFSRDVQ